MEIPPAEIIDRYSIVKLKLERIGGVSIEKEFNVLKDALVDFRENGISIEDRWIRELYEINKAEWDLLEEMNNERKNGDNFEKIGKIYLKTEEVNKKRAEAKNNIVRETGKGFEEIKKDHPSE